MCFSRVQTVVSYVHIPYIYVNENFFVLELINVLIILHENFNYLSKRLLQIYL